MSVSSALLRTELDALRITVISSRRASAAWMFSSAVASLLDVPPCRCDDRGRANQLDDGAQEGGVVGRGVERDDDATWAQHPGGLTLVLPRGSDDADGRSGLTVALCDVEVLVPHPGAGRVVHLDDHPSLSGTDGQHTVALEAAPECAGG
ncbi:MAG: hypothetical protein ACRCYX_08200 [Dermatophilaceae bacterium]